MGRQSWRDSYIIIGEPGFGCPSYHSLRVRGLDLGNPATLPAVVMRSMGFLHAGCECQIRCPMSKDASYTPVS